MLARTLKPGPRYLLMVLALAGDSTMTRLCVLPRGPPSGAAAAALRGLRAGAGLSAPAAGAAAFLRGLLAAGVGVSAGCFLRAGTGDLSRVVAVVFPCKLATITILRTGRPSPILYPFAECQVPAGATAASSNPPDCPPRHVRQGRRRVG